MFDVSPVVVPRETPEQRAKHISRAQRTRDEVAQHFLSLKRANLLSDPGALVTTVVVNGELVRDLIALVDRLKTRVDALEGKEGNA